MAGVRSSLASRLILLIFLLDLSLLARCGPVSVPLNEVPEALARRALKCLNDDSPTHHTYKGGNLISAQKLVEPPHEIYRLTFDLTPVCKDAIEPCPRELCTVEAKRHESGDITVLLKESVCMYHYPQSSQDDSQTQDGHEATDGLDRHEAATQSVELAHEIQVTGDQNDRPFIAMRASNPSYCPGCPYELNPNLPGLAAFGEEVARSMDELIMNNYKHKLVSIRKVTRAVPPSSDVIQYQILMQIGETDCLKNAIVDQIDCSVQPDTPLKTCLVMFEEKPWQRSSRAITKNNCTAQAQSPKLWPGIESEAQVTVTQDRQESVPRRDDEAMEGLREVLENFTFASTTKTEAKEDKEEAAVTEHPIVKVLLNRTEDQEEGARFLDKEREFAEFLEGFELPVKQAEPSPTPDRDEVKEDVILPKRVRRRPSRRQALVGAPSQKDVQDPEVQEFARQGLSKFSENSEGSNEPILVEVTEATVKVVSGLLYKIKVKLGSSDCPKGVRENCRLKSDSEIKECLFTVWSQPWKGQASPEITIDCDLDKNNANNNNSSSRRRKRSLRGAFYSQKMLKQYEDIGAMPMFENFVRKYGRTYDSVKERKQRFENFKRNLKVIERLTRAEQGTAEYGVTRFADLTQKEFRTMYLGLRPDLRTENEIPMMQAEIPDVDLPERFDWREKNAVTPVKDQGQCGSCWAFSVTGNVEGQYSIKHGNLLSLSEQELVDCDNLDEGCNGGLPDNAYRALEKLGGLELETDYPYDARDEKCHFKRDKARVKVVSAVNITSDENDMAKWLVKNGPISIGINANAMQFYLGGVSHPFKFLCSPNNLDHGVLIVGYGVSRYPLFHKELPYWIIKNSWGPRWGEQGYYRVYRGDGTCGVNMMASSSVVD